MKRAVSFLCVVAALAILCSCVEPLSNGDPAGGTGVEGDPIYGTGGDNGGGADGDDDVVIVTDLRDEDREGTLTGYKIKNGDLLAIDGGIHQIINRRVKVDERGEITLVFIGKVKVVGLTKWQVEELLIKKYKPYFKNLQITVEILDLRYFIGGEIRIPGQKPINKDITLTQAIQVAGGYGPFANKKKVKIIRKGEDGKTVILKFNCDKIEKGQAEDPYVKPGDQITVPR